MLKLLLHRNDAGVHLDCEWQDGFTCSAMSGSSSSMSIKTSPGIKCDVSPTHTHTHTHTQQKDIYTHNQSGFVVRHLIIMCVLRLHPSSSSSTAPLSSSCPGRRMRQHCSTQSKPLQAPRQLLLSGWAGDEAGLSTAPAPSAPLTVHCNPSE